MTPVTGAFSFNDCNYSPTVNLRVLVTPRYFGMFPPWRFFPSLWRGFVRLEKLNGVNFEIHTGQTLFSTKNDHVWLKRVPTNVPAALFRGTFFSRV